MYYFKFPTYSVTSVIALLLLITGCSKKDELSDRQIALNDYQENYLGSIVNDPEWTGSVSNCIAGNVSQATNQKIIQRINYFRRMVGLNDNIELDENNQNYMEAALICKANNMLDHQPPSNWLCWSQNAYDGCISSNLSLGNHSVDAITGQMRDNGIHNYPVGHRRWILHSKKLKFNHGSTNNSMSLGCVGNHLDGNSNFPEYIAYPPNGYIPQELIFNRWSFSLPGTFSSGADFSNAQVSMSGPDGNINLNVVSRTDNGYGDNTIVWEPQQINTSSIDDISYEITISNIENSAISTYSYTVVIFKP
tara:strand:- start:7 stop:927 length:921 start_codon:yes stop_codon:yes gene_type:complete